MQQDNDQVDNTRFVREVCLPNLLKQTTVVSQTRSETTQYVCDKIFLFDFKLTKSRRRPAIAKLKMFGCGAESIAQVKNAIGWKRDYSNCMEMAEGQQKQQHFEWAAQRNYDEERALLRLRTEVVPRRQLPFECEPVNSLNSCLSVV